MKGLNLNRLAALMVKEGQQIVRDPSSILIAFVLPLILLFLFGYGLSLDTPKVKLGVLLEESSPLARDLAQKVLDSPHLEAQLLPSRPAGVKALSASQLRALLIIPAEWEQQQTKLLQLKPDHLGSLPPASLQIITDGGEPNTAQLTVNVLQGIIASWSEETASKTGAKIESKLNLLSRIWYNPQAESRQSIVPGCLAIIMALIGVILTSLVMAKEWERGTMEALMATPLSIIELILGKLLPYLILGILSMLLCTAVSRLLFGLPFNGSVGSLLLISVLFLICALGQGLLISTITRNQFTASMAALVTGMLPAVFLSGFIFELGAMPLILRILAHILPPLYLVSSLQTIFLVGDVPAIIFIDAACLSVIGLLFLIIIVKKTPANLE